MGETKKTTKSRISKATVQATDSFSIHESLEKDEKSNLTAMAIRMVVLAGIGGFIGFALIGWTGSVVGAISGAVLGIFNLYN